MHREAMFRSGSPVSASKGWLRMAELGASFFQAPSRKPARRPERSVPRAPLQFSSRSGVAPFGRTAGGSDQPSLDSETYVADEREARSGDDGRG